MNYRIIKAVARLTATQGFATRHDLLALGATYKGINSLVERREVQRILKNCYVAPGHTVDFDVQARALARETTESTRAAVSHFAAAHIHGFPLLNSQRRLTLTNHSNSLRRRDGVRVHRPDSPRRTILCNDARITDPLDTALDCALAARNTRECVPILDAYLRSVFLVERIDLRAPSPRLEKLIEFAREELRERCRELRANVPVQVREAIALAHPGAESILESLGRATVHAMGLTQFVPQLPVRTSRGTAYLDLGWREARIAIEFDGRGKNDSHDKLLAERERERALTNAGWRVLRFDWFDVFRAEEFEVLLHSFFDRAARA